MNPRERKVTFECGHYRIYDSYYPEPGEPITCVSCNKETMVTSVDSRMLAVRCPECSNRVVAKTALRATVTASMLQAKHNVKNQHHSEVVTIGELAEQPCLITLNLVPVDELS